MFQLRSLQQAAFALRGGDRRRQPQPERAAFPAATSRDRRAPARIAFPGGRGGRARWPRQSFDGRQQIERNIRGLIIVRAGVGDVMHQTTPAPWCAVADVGFGPGPAKGLTFGGPPRVRPAPGPPPGPWRCIPHNPRRPKSGRQRKCCGSLRSSGRPGASRAVDVSIPVDLAVAQELGVLQAGNQPQHPLLLTGTSCGSGIPPGCSCRTADSLAATAPRRKAGARFSGRPAHWLHGAKPQRVVTPPRRSPRSAGRLQRTFTSSNSCACDGLRAHQRLMEDAVFLLGEGAVQIIFAAFAVARSAEDALHVQRFGIHNRG